MYISVHAVRDVCELVHLLTSQAFLFLHYLWLGPLYVAVYTYLVYQEVGPSAFLATGFVVIQIPLQMFLAKLFAFFK